MELGGSRESPHHLNNGSFSNPPPHHHPDIIVIVIKYLHHRHLRDTSCNDIWLVRQGGDQPKVKREKPICVNHVHCALHGAIVDGAIVDGAIVLCCMQCVKCIVKATAVVWKCQPCAVQYNTWSTGPLVQIEGDQDVGHVSAEHSIDYSFIGFALILR